MPVTGTGGAQRDLLYLHGNVTGIGEVGSDPERLARDSGGEGILRVYGKAGSATIGVGRSDDGGERDPERLHDGAVELSLLYAELMKDIVFVLSREIGGGYFLHQQLRLFQTGGEHRDEPGRLRRGEGAGGLVDGRGNLAQAGGEEGVLAWGKGGYADDGGVDAIKIRALCIRGWHARSVAVVGDVKGAWEGDAGAAVLGFLQAEALATELDIGAAESGVIGTLMDGDVGGRHGIGPLAGNVVIEAHRGPLAGGVVVHTLRSDGEGRNAGIDFERRPGEKAGLDLIGKDGGVSGGLEGFLCHFARDLVLAVAVGDAANEDGGEDQGAIEADGANDVVEDALVSPDGQGFLEGLGETEISDAGEVLIDSVAAAGSQKLLGAHQRELIPEVIGHDVLPTLAPGQREQSHACALATGLIGEHAAILVVGMGNDHHDASAGGKLAQRLLERSRATIDPQRLIVRGCGNGGGGWDLGRKRGRGEEQGGDEA